MRSMLGLNCSSTLCSHSCWSDVELFVEFLAHYLHCSCSFWSYFSMARWCWMCCGATRFKALLLLLFLTFSTRKVQSCGVPSCILSPLFERHWLPELLWVIFSSCVDWVLLFCDKCSDELVYSKRGFLALEFLQNICTNAFAIRRCSARLVLRSRVAHWIRPTGKHAAGCCIP